MRFTAALNRAEVFSAEVFTVSESTVGYCCTSFGRALSQLCPFLPKHFSVIHCGLGQKRTEEDLEYIWLR